jgi:hypothetical protein
MPNGIHVVLRCRQEGDEARYLGRHGEGDRVNLEGELQELRFQDAGGAARTAHQLLVRRWGYARDRAGARV